MWGGYDDWLWQRERVEKTKTEKRAAPKLDRSAAAKPKKLSYKDQRELDALPKRLEALEEGIKRLQAVMSDPTFYQKSSEEMAKANEQLKSQEDELAAVYARWEALEALL